MIKLIRNITILILCGILFYIGTLIVDKQYLRNDIMLIQIADISNAGADQTAKVLIQNIFNNGSSDAFSSEISLEAVQKGRESAIQQLVDIVEEKLSLIGITDSVDVVLAAEHFNELNFDNISLPSGVYNSLYINIGGIKGDEQRCVVFPVLNYPNQNEYLLTNVTPSGMSYGPIKVILNKEDYKIRFNMLELIGKIEKFFLNLSE